MSIKIIQTKDTDLIASLNHDVQEIHHNIEPTIFKPFDHTSMKGLFDSMIDDENVWVYVAYFQSQAAGYILLKHTQKTENFFKYAYDVLSIDQICVDSAFKGKGVGKALVDMAKEKAKSLGAKRIEMDFWVANKNSGEFFSSQGFETFNQRMAFKL